MPGALLGVIKEIYPKRGVIEYDRGKPGCPDLWIVNFDKTADNLQVRLGAIIVLADAWSPESGLLVCAITDWSRMICR